MNQINWKYFGLIAIVLVLWASAFVSIRHALEMFTAGNLAFLRYVIASVIFAIAAYIRKIKVPEKKDIPGCVLLGFMGFTLYNLLLNYGERTVDAGLASFIINTSPFFSLLVVVFLKEEKLSKTDWTGLLLAFTGVAVIIFTGKSNFTLHADALLILGASLSQGIYFVLQKRFLKKYSPLEITSYAVWAGTAILFFFSDNPLSALVASDWRHIASVVYLGIFPGTVAYLLVAYTLAKYNMSSFASYMFLIPFIALLIGFLFMKEIPSIIALAGGALIISGILIKNNFIKYKT